MKHIVLIGLVCCVSTAQAQTAPPKPASDATSLSIKTANDLANACTITPNSKDTFARLTFCNGFAQGILHTNAQDKDGTKICMPNPSPKRSDTMKEFATWVRADVARRVEAASTAFLRFMAGRFPCKP
jgi:hypothetical protein